MNVELPPPSALLLKVKKSILLGHLEDSFYFFTYDVMLEQYYKAFKAYDIRGIYQTEIDAKFAYIL
jgi:hypothetical protein